MKHPLIIKASKGLKIKSQYDTLLEMGRVLKNSCLRPTTFIMNKEDYEDILKFSKDPEGDI